MIRRTAFLLVFLSIIDARGEEQVRSAQEELRRRNLYFGDIDGRRSGEYQEAVKRYQKRKGFSANGREDAETMRSLGLLPRTLGEAPPKEIAWPEEPVLRSDTKLDVAKEATEVAAATGVSVESIAPAAMRLVPIAGKAAAAGQRQAVAGAATQKKKTGAAQSSRGSENAKDDAQKVTPAEVQAFVAKYLKAVSRGDLKDELCYYADRVNYYGNGEVDRRIIEHSLRGYYKIWTGRSYKLGDVVRYRYQPKTGQIAVVFRVDFSLKSARTKVKGSTENEFIINGATSSPRIVAINERRVRS